MHGPGKKQKRQHTVQQGLIEVDRFQHLDHTGLSDIYTQPAQ